MRHRFCRTTGGRVYGHINSFKENLMKFKGLLIIPLLLFGLTQTAQATLVFTFTQDGYSSGGTVSGVFRGTDADGDGRIYAQPNPADLSNPLGNELDYAKVVFTGFAGVPDPIVLEYDGIRCRHDSLPKFLHGVLL
jgi:hypothetical protein